MAVRLEREKSKEEILTYYINKVYMANGFMEWKQRLKIIMVNIYLNLIYHKRPYWQECHKRQTHDPYTKPDTAKERRDVVLLHNVRQ